MASYAVMVSAAVSVSVRDVRNETGLMHLATPTFRSPRRRLFSFRTSCRSTLARTTCLVVNNLSPFRVNYLNLSVKSSSNVFH